MTNKQHKALDRFINASINYHRFLKADQPIKGIDRDAQTAHPTRQQMSVAKKEFMESGEGVSKIWKDLRS